MWDISRFESWWSLALVFCKGFHFVPVWVSDALDLCTFNTARSSQADIALCNEYIQFVESHTYKRSSAPHELSRGHNLTVI